MGTEEHFSLPYFCQLFLRCQNELKSAQAILATVLTPLKEEIAHLNVQKKVLQTVTGNANMEITNLKRGLP